MKGLSVSLAEPSPGVLKLYTEAYFLCPNTAFCGCLHALISRYWLTSSQISREAWCP